MSSTESTESTTIEVEMSTTPAIDEDEPAPPPTEDIEEGRKSTITEDPDSDDDDDIHTSLRTKTRRDELLNDAEDNQNLIGRLFPRDPKAIGTRRYIMVIFAGTVLVAIFSFLFAQYYTVSVLPVQQLSNTDMYQPRVCTVLEQTLFHDVTVGLGSSWRGELRVEYNTIRDSNDTKFIASVHELVSGQLGFKHTAVEFLRRPDHQVGATFNCLVDIQDMPYYAVPVVPEQSVARSVITGMTFIMIFDLIFAFLMLRSLYNFYLFRRYYQWNADLNVWVVEAGAGSREEMLPP